MGARFCLPNDELNMLKIYALGMSQGSRVNNHNLQLAENESVNQGVTIEMEAVIPINARDAMLPHLDLMDQVQLDLTPEKLSFKMAVFWGDLRDGNRIYTEKIWPVSFPCLNQSCPIWISNNIWLGRLNSTLHIFHSRWSNRQGEDGNLCRGQGKWNTSSAAAPNNHGGRWAEASALKCSSVSPGGNWYSSSTSVNTDRYRCVKAINKTCVGSCQSLVYIASVSISVRG